MTTLDKAEIEFYWKTPQNKVEIQLADWDNQRQSFHAKLITSKQDAERNPYYKEFLKFVSSVLNNTDKFNRYTALQTFPLPSNMIISEATDEWNKTFSAQDRSVELNFTDDALVKQFEAYLTKIQFQKIIEQSLFTKVKQCVNTIAVVDVPSILTGAALTEPYVYFLDTGKLHDVGVDTTGVIEYIMFQRHAYNKHELVIIDGTNYATAEIKDDGELGTPTFYKHDLGFCPAKFAWDDLIDPDVPIRRYNSTLESLGDMDWYVMADVFKKHVDLYSSFPIVWRYLDYCEPEKPGDTTPQSDDERDAMEEETDYVGPGHMIEMTLPQGENAKMGVPVGFVSAERTLLDYNKEKVDALKTSILRHLTGVDGNVENDKAFNESQVRSQYETRHSVLRYWGENIESTHKFLLDTIASLIYGPAEKGGSYVGSTVYYGMDYFLYDKQTATVEYQEAKDARMPMYVRAHYRRVVQQMTTRHSPNARNRFDILEQLEPYLDANIDEIQDKLGPDFQLKANFQFYIDKFEREVTSILKFGANLEYGKRIELIKQKLYEYVQKDINDAQKRADATADKEASRQAASRGNGLRQSGQG